MINFRVTTAIFAAAVGMVAVAPRAGADQWNKLTYITISEPVEVPGAVLPPGRYVFKLVDSQSDRHIVTVQNDRQNHTYATILAVPDYRTVPTGKTVFTFRETPAGQPKAVREWFYPGDNFGQEFVYHKKFTQVAQVNRQTEAPPPPPAAEAPAPVPPAEVAENTPPPPPEPAPQAEPPAPAPQPEAAPEAPVSAPNTIPQTAGNVPLLALLGFGSIGLALGVGALAKRMN
jgi:hypothetical protein